MMGHVVKGEKQVSVGWSFTGVAELVIGQEALGGLRISTGEGARLRVTAQENTYLALGRHKQCPQGPCLTDLWLFSFSI